MIAKLREAAAMLVVAALPLAAHAAANGAVETRLEARKVVRAPDGRESFAAAQSARPGDVIEYAATYRNTTRDTIRNLEATLPIPANTEYVPGSQRPASAKASVDARDFAAPPLKRRVVREGREVDEAVPYREYRYLRWQAPELAGEQAVTFTARVKVLE